MSTALTVSSADELAQAVEKVVVKGDLKSLSPAERVDYYNAVCKSLGLNPLTRPFEYVTLNGKEQLYARKDCTDQLCRVHRVSRRITDARVVDGIYVVTCQATTPEGREDTATGAVSIEGLKGEGKANAMLKAETKAKRRAVLSLCGLGVLDETEVEDIPAEAKAKATAQPQLAPAPEIFCELCGAQIEEWRIGKKVFTPAELAQNSREKYGTPMCSTCVADRVKSDKEATPEAVPA